MLNIGCGKVFQRNWVNVDMFSTDRDVLCHDITTGLPFPDSEFDVCYSSHTLEHLARNEARALVAEIYRILKPAGLVRFVVPDLENIVAKYFGVLADFEKALPGAEENHEWMMLELYDQAVRTQSGGEMAVHLKRKDLPNKDFIYSRIGPEAYAICSGSRAAGNPFFRGLRGTSFSWLLKKARYSAAAFFVYVIAGAQALREFREGIFRNSGEVHRRMYDRCSLRSLLTSHGFDDFEIRRYNESSIPDFYAFELDHVKGVQRKPNSLYVEASKPVRDPDA
jgi:predicted SAM-dependent methyltransferase